MTYRTPMVVLLQGVVGCDGGEERVGARKMFVWRD